MKLLAVFNAQFYMHS